MTEQKNRRTATSSIANQIFMCMDSMLMGSAVTLLAWVMARPFDPATLELKGDGFLGRRAFSPNWYPDDERPAGSSISFRNRLLPDVRMQFSAYDSTELIGALDEKGLKQYLAKQMNEYRKDRLLLQNAQAERAAVGSIPFMGKSYWKISFDLMDVDSRKYRYSVVDFVTVVDDKYNYRLRFTGSEKSLGRQSSAMKRELSLFSMN